MDTNDPIIGEHFVNDTNIRLRRNTWSHIESQSRMPAKWCPLLLRIPQHGSINVIHASREMLSLGGLGRQPAP